MRKDMFKVIVERPRVGGKYERAAISRQSNMDHDELPTKQGMRRRVKDRKSLNENLKPLERFFKSRLGRRWDDVFSEVCENLSPDSAVQKHVRDHVKDLVHLNVMIQDGKVLDKRYAWGGEFHEIWNGDLYVHPESGILKRYRSKHRRTRWSAPSPEAALNAALKTLNLFLDEGVLYKIEKSRPRSPKYDTVQESHVKANGTHALTDLRLMGGILRGVLHKNVTRSLYNEHEYFRVAWDAALAEDERIAHQREVEKQKKEEIASQTTEKV